MHRYKLPYQPQAASDSIVTSNGASYRFTILTEGLLRLEWSDSGKFEDRASTFATFRNQPTPDYRLIDHGANGLELVTNRFRLTYDKQTFSASGLTVQVLGSMTNYDSIWRYGQQVSDLGGTARTLDEVDGPVDLGPAVVSRRGFALIDDSNSMLFEANGWVAPRDNTDQIDLYLFAYGHDYTAAIRALYALSGSQPLLPRWALGNWWSRYYAYTEKEYLELMDDFKRKNIPLSVAVLDMDWHLVKQDVCQKAGVSGWTGYTWDKSLFPDPARFGREIHKRGLMLTLNDHPADGVYSYEEPYESLAHELGHDTSDKQPIPFDITNQRFCDAFFDKLHRRIEDESGCDFWWIDWQQGSISKVPGIDPLWMLNHFHFLDNTRSGRHPLTFSRFAGPGSHRTPVGFSGDSIVSWASLKFQPQFTNCASNIGYGWWSHDIGGHMHGRKDDELQTRWVQYGVFSPIMRLHSTANPWNTKEPWSFGAEHTIVQSEFMRWRHRLVPYIQTMNIRAAQGDLPLCRPMYWSHPQHDEAYDVPNQYMFGTSLMVAPITSRRNNVTFTASTKAWLPDGTYFDLFTGTLYQGGRLLWFHRTLDRYPVLAACGSIIPLDAAYELENGCPIPQYLEVLVVAGADGSFDLLEEQLDQHSVASLDKTSRTSLMYSYVNGTFTIKPPSASIAPHPTRSWSIRFQACRMPSVIKVRADEELIFCVARDIDHGFVLNLEDVPYDKEIEISFDEALTLTPASHIDHCYNLLQNAQVAYNLKEKVWSALTLDDSRLRQASRLSAIGMESELLDVLFEQIFAYGS